MTELIVVRHDEPHHKRSEQRVHAQYIGQISAKNQQNEDSGNKRFVNQLILVVHAAHQCEQRLEHAKEQGCIEQQEQKIEERARNATTLRNSHYARQHQPRSYIRHGCRAQRKRA